jgi:phage terminase large subunit
MVLDIPTAEVYEPFLYPARYKGAHGGRGSAKSHTFADLAIDRAICKRGTRIVCIREVQRTLEQSVKRLIEDKIKSYHLNKYFRVTNTHIETPGDGIMIFQGMQNHTAESIKSLEGFHYAWVEEAQSLSDRSLTLLRPTIREKDSEIWLSWNPRFPTDPVDRMLRDTVLPPDSVVIKSTYRDNPWFPDVLRTEMEWDKSRDYDKYLHVWEGEYEKHSSARVFKNWRVEEFDTPDNAVFLLGGDWGYSVDPAVGVRMWVEDNLLSIDREVYKIGCEIDHLPALFDTLDNEVSPSWPEHQKPGMAREWELIADSSRPDTISYMNRHGYKKIKPSKKGKDSIKEGVIFLQGFDIRIHPRCKHTIDEFTHYSYKVDEKRIDPDTNEPLVLPELQDKKNHVIDSVRYAVEKLQKQKFSAVW